MDSLTYDQQSTPGMMDALIEMLRMKRQQETQPPQGVGPVASGDMYGEMLRPKAAGSIPLDVGQPAQGPVENAPIDQIIAALTPGKSDLAMAGMGREMAQFTGPRGLDWLPAEERSRVVGKPSGKNNKVSVSSDVPAPMEGESATPLIEDIQKSVGPSAGDVAEPTPEQVVATKAILQEKIASSPTMTPEEKQQKTNELNSDPSIGQKLAMIAMAVAPTLVGYAAGGTKGAYLGAASTGKGLEAGAKSYQEEDQFNKKQALEREKIGIEKKSKSDTVVDVDQYGRKFIIDKQTGRTIPVNISGEGQMTESETEVFNPASQMWERKKFRDIPGSSTGSGMEIVSLVDELGKIAATKDKKGKPLLPRGYLNDPEITDIVKRYPGIKIGDPAPTGVSKKTWERLQTQILADKERLKKAADKIQTTESTYQEKQQGPDRAGDARYSQTIKGMVEREYVPLNDLKNRTQPYLDQMNKDLKNVTDPMKWQSFLKTIQQDASVVRPGESEMAMQFMPVSQKIDSWFNRYGKLDSVMTAELGRDINQLFVNLRKIKESNFVDKMNEEKLNAANLGKDRVFEQSMTGDGKTIVKDWAREHLASSKKMTPVEVAQGMKAGQLKNGDMFYSPQGKPYMIRGIKYDGNTFQQTTPGRAVPWRFQP